MTAARIPLRELPQMLQDESAALAADFSRLPHDRRWRAIRDNRSAASWRCIDEVVSLRRATLAGGA